MNKKKMGLTTMIFIGLILGAIFGAVINPMPSGYVKDTLIVGGLLKVIGKLFVSSIKMLVVPLVFISLVCGSAAIGDVKKLGRVGVKTLSFYLATTAIAISIALMVANFIDPGKGLDMSKLQKAETTVAAQTSVIDVITGIIPDNPIAAMATGNMLQIIFFSLLVGISLAHLGSKGERLVKLFEDLNELIMKMITIIMLAAPVGVFALVASTFATMGWGAAKQLAKYMICVVLALLIHCLFTYTGALTFIGRINPLNFFKKFAPVMNVAFSTASSNATIPVNVEACEEKLGVSKNIASFTIPLGATINMDGTAIMQGVAVIFIAQIYGIELTMTNFLTVILMATLASIGTAGVPSVGLITLSMVLQSVNLPVEGIAMIMGIDRILDMCRTVVNITGDAMCTILVAKSEGEFNIDVYNKKEEKKVA